MLGSGLGLELGFRVRVRVRVTVKQIALAFEPSLDYRVSEESWDSNSNNDNLVRVRLDFETNCIGL